MARTKPQVDPTCCLSKVSCPRYNPPLVFSGILNGRTTNLHPVGLGNLFDSFVFKRS
jgi:hypothetical protein